MRFLTAGESHGKCLMGILEGIPANLKIDIAQVNAELARRQQGYGRGGRMAIESDTVEFVAGIRGGVTTGAPIGFFIANKDYENWAGIIGADASQLDERKVTAVRPGHADLAGCIKYAQSDARNILERASARETAAKVVIGAIAKQYLAELGIRVTSFTTGIDCVFSMYDCEERGCNQCGHAFEDIIARADRSPVRAMSPYCEKEFMKYIDEAKKSGDTLGGEVRVIARGMPVGIGSHIAFDKRLEYKIAGHLMAIPSVKGVAVGNIFTLMGGDGSQTHDALSYDKNGKIVRKTNNAGGIEGGISNGEDIVVMLGIKPVPSVPKGIPSIDIQAKQNAISARERGDTCVVPAAGVVAEAVLAYALAEAIAETLGGDHMAEVRERMRLKRDAF
ncbi:MAG: chorismate synthase [Firmicutes bacterium]|nr:chorismate synthase [Bacillota bacterium]